MSKLDKIKKEYNEKLKNSDVKIEYLKKLKQKNREDDSIRFDLKKEESIRQLLFQFLKDLEDI